MLTGANPFQSTTWFHWLSKLLTPLRIIRRLEKETVHAALRCFAFGQAGPRCPRGGRCHSLGHEGGSTHQRGTRAGEKRSRRRPGVAADPTPRSAHGGVPPDVGGLHRRFATYRRARA